MAWGGVTFLCWSLATLAAMQGILAKEAKVSVAIESSTQKFNFSDTRELKFPGGVRTAIESLAALPPTAAPALAPGAAGAPGMANQENGINLPGCMTDFCCLMDIVGTGEIGGIASASVQCAPGPSNPDPQSKPLIYMGTSLIQFGYTFTGVTAVSPNEAGFLSPDAIFLVTSVPTTITISGSFVNIANDQSPLVTVSLNYRATFLDCLFMGNSGRRHAAIAVSDLQHADVINSRFVNNSCSCQSFYPGEVPCPDSNCHNAAIYSTEGATVDIINSTFDGNVGHFGGAILATSGGSFSATNCTFRRNRADVYGSFGGAIFFNLCGVTSSGIAVASTGRVDGCNFDENASDGWGGAIAVDGCSDISIAGGSFAGNTASIAGGAVYLANIGDQGQPSGTAFGTNAAPACSDAAYDQGFQFSPKCA